MANSIEFVGESSVCYQYGIYAVNSVWNPVSANYCFARLSEFGWVPLYFGEAENLQQRLSNHERWPEAEELGATHILAHVNENGEFSRTGEERDLIRNYFRTLINKEHNPLHSNARDGLGLNWGGAPFMGTDLPAGPLARGLLSGFQSSHRSTDSSAVRNLINVSK